MLRGVKGQEARRGCENGAVEQGQFIQFPSKLSTDQDVNE